MRLDSTSEPVLLSDVNQIQKFFQLQYFLYGRGVFAVVIEMKSIEGISKSHEVSQSL